MRRLGNAEILKMESPKIERLVRDNPRLLELEKEMALIVVKLEKENPSLSWDFTKNEKYRRLLKDLRSKATLYSTLVNILLRAEVSFFIQYYE